MQEITQTFIVSLATLQHSLPPDSYFLIIFPALSSEPMARRESILDNV
jgi:hypothetical protein